MILSWMAWTWQTAAFFIFIVAAIFYMGIWEHKKPGGDPRRGILRLDTTRGDRLFISMLGSAFINIIWLALVGQPLWGALVLSGFFFYAVFKWV
ncbi:MAG: DUF2160 domain-containing protein [Proteobacteria bacterium]|nr:DUF2160 domain-containing protein [Pseudomonadota bacterium]